MPELPEVEGVRKGLNRLLTDKVIADVDVYWPNIIVSSRSIEDWEVGLVKQQIKQISRRGKYLIFELNDFALISHLRMEGKYLFFLQNQLPTVKDKHTHVIFHFYDKTQLHYHDVRKFGRMEVIPIDEVDSYFHKKKIGPEPTLDTFNFDDFYDKLTKIKRSIKAVLLEQKLVAGIGNIYADEVLFLAKIHPAIPANQMSYQQAERLHEAVIKVMAAAIQAGGSSIRTYRNALGKEGTYQNQLAVYGRNGEECLVCRTSIEKIKVAQRGTHFCPNCQKFEAVSEG